MLIGLLVFILVVAISLLITRLLFGIRPIGPAAGVTDLMVATFLVIIVLISAVLGGVAHIGLLH